MIMKFILLLRIVYGIWRIECPKLTREKRDNFQEFQTYKLIETPVHENVSQDRICDNLTDSEKVAQKRGEFMWLGCMTNAADRPSFIWFYLSPVSKT